MKRDDIEFKLSEMLDGELPADQAEALRRELDANPDLAAEHRRYESLDAVLGEMGRRTVEVDWDLQRESIRATLEREALLQPQRRTWPARLIRLSAAAAAAAAVIVLAVLAGHWLLVGPAPTGEVHVAWQAPGAATGAAVAGVLGPSPLPSKSAALEVAYVRTAPIEMPEPPLAGRVGTIVVAAGGTARPDQAAELWGLDRI